MTMEAKSAQVVVIGAGLTGLTTAFYLTRRGISVHILEASARTGGQIHTYKENDFIYESGPNTGVVSYPEVAELFAALSPHCELETAKEESKRRLIWKGDRFRELPSGLLSAVTTPLFTLKDKFRILGEPFRSKGSNPDESVAQLAARRLGQSFVDYAVDPFLSGVYAGNPHTLITRYALPKLYNLEQEYGSFIRGTIAKAKIPKTERDLLASKKVFSARQGLGNLAEALTKAIGSKHITLQADNVTILPHNGKWEIKYNTPHGEHTYHASQVVSTIGAYNLPNLLPFIDRKEMASISNLTYAPVIQASVGFKNTGTLRFNAFGGLVPSKEKKKILGILFPSACFEGRAPEEGALFSFFMGGMKHQDLLQKNDEELINLIREELHLMLGFQKEIEPDLLKIFRHHRAIPQYELNSGKRFETIEKLEEQYPGLHIAGNLKGGIGMADRIRQATQLGLTLAKKE